MDKKKVKKIGISNVMKEEKEKKKERGESMVDVGEIKKKIEI